VTDKHSPGGVYMLPPSWISEREKDRRRVLMSHCDSTYSGSVAYASRASTEQAQGAPCVPIRARQAGVNANGFSDDTIVYPGILRIVGAEELTDRRGHVRPELVALRRELRAALGIDAGTLRGHPEFPGSWRGRIVSVERSARVDPQSQFALVLTDPFYSASEGYQTLVPLFLPSRYSPVADDIAVRNERWVSAIAPKRHEIIVAISFVYSVYTNQLRQTIEIVTEGVMRRIDKALSTRFQLDRAD
jgi:hypothetical protein